MKRFIWFALALALVLVSTSGCVKHDLEPSRRGGTRVEAPQVKSTRDEAAPDEATQEKAAVEGVSPVEPHLATETKKSQAVKSVVPLAGLLHASASTSLERLPADLKFILPNRAYKGEPFVLKIGSSKLEKAVITWRGKSITLLAGQDGQEKHTCEILLSVGLVEKAKQLPLVITLTVAGQGVTFKCQVPTGQRKYAVQKLKVDPRFVTPPVEERPRIERERKIMAGVLSQITPVKYWTIPMKRPVSGVVTSVYGLRRVFNGEVRGSHRGLDLDGLSGEPIYSCDDGKVALVADHYYSGKVVVVDHGLGVFTLYLHMSDFNVREEQMVRRGDVLGFVGATGRVTGPHLHLSLNVLQNSVNPDVYLEKKYVGN